MAAYLGVPEEIRRRPDGHRYLSDGAIAAGLLLHAAHGKDGSLSLREEQRNTRGGPGRNSGIGSRPGSAGLRCNSGEAQRGAVSPRGRGAGGGGLSKALHPKLG